MKATFVFEKGNHIKESPKEQKSLPIAFLLNLTDKLNHNEEVLIKNEKSGEYEREKLQNLKKLVIDFDENDHFDIS